MHDLLVWAVDDGLRLLGDIVIPAAAILVPTYIAVRLARQERLDSRTAAAEERADMDEKDQRARRLDAGRDVIVAFAEMIQFDPIKQDVRPLLTNLRARIAVYRAWTTNGDVSGDWLAYKHHEGGALWGIAFEQIQAATDQLGLGFELSTTGVAPMAHEPRAWANMTVDTFSRWLRGDLTNGHLRQEIRAVQEKFGTPNASDGTAQHNPDNDDR